MNKFELWWWNIGSGITPVEGHDHEQHAERICKLFWEYLQDLQK